MVTSKVDVLFSCRFQTHIFYLDDKAAVVDMTIPHGVRVIRGPDWSWSNQDGGEGCLGTVVESNKGPPTEGTVMVRWDHGKHNNGYRVGRNASHDLRVVDNGPLGVKHLGKSCKYCSEDIKLISGLLWSCTTCADVFLCTKHYMAEKHDLNHPFLRLDHDG